MTYALRLLLATTNPDKLREISAVLQYLPLEIATLRDLAPVPEPEETGATFAENARLKALYYDAAAEADTAPATARPDTDLGSDVGADLRGAPTAHISTPSRRRARWGPRAGAVGCEIRPRRRYTVAEDSGLVIDALGGEPGVHSARFLRPNASYPERFAEIYRRLDLDPTGSRSARFVCALAVVHKGTVIYEATGTIEGFIADAPAGEGGFGYDPIFHYPPYGRTLAEVTEDAKLRVAHRGEAFRRLAAWLEGRSTG